MELLLNIGKIMKINNVNFAFHRREGMVHPQAVVTQVHYCVLMAFLLGHSGLGANLCDS